MTCIETQLTYCVGNECLSYLLYHRLGPTSYHGAMCKNAMCHAQTQLAGIMCKNFRNAMMSFVHVPSSFHVCHNYLIYLNVWITLQLLVCKCVVHNLLDMAVLWAYACTRASGISTPRNGSSTSLLNKLSLKMSQFCLAISSPPLYNRVGIFGLEHEHCSNIREGVLSWSRRRCNYKT